MCVRECHGACDVSGRDSVAGCGRLTVPVVDDPGAIKLLVDKLRTNVIEYF